MFDTIAQQYLSGLRSDGSGVADQPNANWAAMDPSNPQFATYLQGFGAGTNPAVDWSKLGYQGPGVSYNPRSDNPDAPGQLVSSPDAFGKWASSNGLGLMTGSNGQGFDLAQLTQNGAPVNGASRSYSKPDNSSFNIVQGLVNAGLLAGAGTAAYGAYGASGSAAGGGLSSADTAALYGNAGYGATGAEAGSGALGETAAGAGAVGGSAPAYGGVGTSGAGAGSDAIIGANGVPTSLSGTAAGSIGSGTGGTSPGFWNSLASGNYADAASAAGNWATTPGGLQTLGGLGSALLQSNAAGKALSAQTDATNSANALSKYVYDTNRADNAPLLATRNNALMGLNGLISNPNSITSDPGYQFGLNQGTRAVTNSAAGQGGLYSGATLKALQRFGTDYGTTKLNDSFNRLSGAAGLGQAATNSNLSSGNNYANTVGNNLTGLGTSAGKTDLYSGTLWSNALNGAASAYINPPKQGG